MGERRARVARLVAAGRGGDRCRDGRSGDVDADVAAQRDRRLLRVAQAAGEEVAATAGGELALVEQARQRDRREDADDHHDDHQLRHREAALRFHAGRGVRPLRSLRSAQRAHISVAFCAATPVPLGVSVQITLAVVATLQLPVPPTRNWSSVVGATPTRVDAGAGQERLQDRRGADVGLVEDDGARVAGRARREVDRRPRGERAGDALGRSVVGVDREVDELRHRDRGEDAEDDDDDDELDEGETALLVHGADPDVRDGQRGVLSTPW